MNLKDSTYTYKVDNSTFYQFKKPNGFTEVLEIYKTKSGYGFIFEGEIYEVDLDSRTFYIKQK